jgi:peptidyl-prolyl cis-trans isomerase B (cyclophilin B)
MWKILVIGAAILLTLSCSENEPKSRRESFSIGKERPQVVLETEAGKIVLELFPDIAPNHVRNFLDLVERRFYDGLTFHRVVKGLVIQAGSPASSIYVWLNYLILTANSRFSAKRLKAWTSFRK